MTMNDPQHQIKSCSVSIYGMRLDYILCETELPEEDRKSYSIQIRKQTPSQKEEAFAPDVSSIRNFAVGLFDKLVTGIVTPCTMLDILEDLL